MRSLRIAVKIVVGFLFSIFLLANFLATSLFGVKAQDTVRIIVTEATGLRRDMLIFQADLQPLIIHNLFWVFLASLGFLLIFLFFIDHSFNNFLGPGILAIAITIMLALALLLFRDNIYSYAGTVSQLYIKTAVDRFNNTAYATFAFGVVLIALSQWGDRLLRKKGHRAD